MTLNPKPNHTPAGGAADAGAGPDNVLRITKKHTLSPSIHGGHDNNVSVARALGCTSIRAGQDASSVRVIPEYGLHDQHFHQHNNVLVLQEPTSCTNIHVGPDDVGRVALAYMASPSIHARKMRATRAYAVSTSILKCSWYKSIRIPGE